MYMQMERHVGRVWEGPGQRSTCPWGVGVHSHPPQCGCSPIWRLPKPPSVGIQRGFLIGSNRHQARLQPLSPLEVGNRAEKVSASNHSSVFLVASPIQEPTQSGLMRTKGTPSPGTSEGFRELCVRTGSRDEILEQEVLSALLALWKSRGL